MSVWQRVVYVFGSPLIPAVRLARIIRHVVRRRSAWLLGRLLYCLPAATIGLALDAFGQMVGYAVGEGNSLKHIAKYEFHRVRHITPQDRQALFA